MKSFKIITTALALAVLAVSLKSAYAQDEAPEAAQTAAASETAPSPTTEQQSASDLMVIDYEVKDPVRGFKMQVPHNWDVKENVNGYMLFMEPKEKAIPTPENPIVADPNISVAVINQPIVIDEQSLEEYAKEIEKRFTSSNGEGNDFSLYSKHVMDMPDGRKALLYYLSYKTNNIDVGSMILVMGNTTHMFRATYTDYKVSYEKNFEKIFPVMASIQFNGEKLERENHMSTFAFIALGFFALVFGFYRFRRSQAKKMQELYSQVASARKNKSSTKKKKIVNQKRSDYPEDDLND